MDTPVPLSLALFAMVSCVDPRAQPTTIEVLVAPRALAIVEGTSDVLAFDVPADALSVVVAIAGPTSHYLGVADWRGPDGELVPSDWIARRSIAHPEMCTTCDNRVWLARGGSAVIVPSQPGVALEPGRHEVRLVALADLSDSQGSGDMTVEISVDAKVGPSVPARATIDLDVHLATTRWSAADAGSDDDLAAVLDEARAALAGADLDLGAIRFHDAPRAFAVVRGTDSATAPVFDLLSHSTSTRGVDVFLVDRLYPRAHGDSAPIRGWSSSIPVAGPNGSRAAIVIAVEGQTFVGRALAHELGHALGLFHTSESYAGRVAERTHDQLADTPDDDRALLLYYVGFGTGWSPSQGAIVRAHPRVR